MRWKCPDKATGKGSYDDWYYKWKKRNAIVYRTVTQAVAIQMATMKYKYLYIHGARCFFFTHQY